MTELRGIIFDKDGTLFDFSKTWEAWAASFLRRIGQNEQHSIALGAAVGFDFKTQKFARDSIVIAGTPAEVAHALTPQVPGRSIAEILNLINEEAEKAPQAEVVPLKPFINELKRKGYHVGVVTNDAEQPARAHLDTADVTGLFDFIAGFDSGFGAKPAAGQLLAFAQAVEIAPEAVLMVGDSTHDLIAAERAGMRAVGVLTGLADAQILAPFAETVLADIGQLPAWLDQQKTV
ncbi:MAG: HAD family hydrolase [Roseobacter sp.]